MSAEPWMAGVVAFLVTLADKWFFKWRPGLKRRRNERFRHIK